MIKKLSIVSIIGAVVYGLLFFSFWIGSIQGGGFLTALPYLGKTILCIVCAVFFDSLNTMLEKIETYEKRVIKYEEDLHKLEDEIKNMKKDGK